MSDGLSHAALHLNDLTGNLRIQHVTLQLSLCVLKGVEP